MEPWVIRQHQTALPATVTESGSHLTRGENRLLPETRAITAVLALRRPCSRTRKIRRRPGMSHTAGRADTCGASDGQSPVGLHLRMWRARVQILVAAAGGAHARESRRAIRRFISQRLHGLKGPTIVHFTTHHGLGAPLSHELIQWYKETGQIAAVRRLSAEAEVSPGISRDDIVFAHARGHRAREAGRRSRSLSR